MLQTSPLKINLMRAEINGFGLGQWKMAAWQAPFSSKPQRGDLQLSVADCFKVQNS